MIPGQTARSIRRAEFVFADNCEFNPSRFWAKVQMGAECWVWTAATRDGYGAFSTYRAGRNFIASAHRLAYALQVGPIPDGLVLDHLCRNRSCVNPSHLEPVTLQENFRRAPGRDSECRNNHVRTPKNTRRRANGVIQCIDCARARRKREAAKWRDWNTANVPAAPARERS